MTREGRGAAVAAAIAVATAGCGLGPGESSSGEATLVVTHDYGTEPVLEASESDPASSETVIRLLDREAEITTRYGGGFVQSIDGTAGELAGGRSSDWFFFVNGIEADRGGAEVAVRGGDRIWWDYRDWTDAMRTPAVVGSWPEPFLQASTSESDRAPVTVECLGARPPCDEVVARLGDEDVDAVIGEPGSAGRDAPRVLVGPWSRVAADPAAAQIDSGPATSGVFARFESGSLIALGVDGDGARDLGPGAGLVAAVRRAADGPTWVVTGAGGGAVERAAGALDTDQLEQRYAIAVTGDGVVALPAEDDE